MPQCIRCDKTISFLPEPFRGEEVDQVEDGGNVEICCYFGSRHDMGLEFDRGGKPYKSHICDDCIDVIKQRDEKPLNTNFGKDQSDENGQPDSV